MIEPRSRHLNLFWVIIVGKNSFVPHTKQATEANQRSTLFMRDNIQLWILEQRIESVLWCSENKKQEVDSILRIPSILIPIPHGAQDG